jgi:hypothetical protein
MNECNIRTIPLIGNIGRNAGRNIDATFPGGVVSTTMLRGSVTQKACGKRQYFPNETKKTYLPL